MKTFLVGMGIIGAAIGASTWWWQSHIGNFHSAMEMVAMLPFLMISGAVIVPGALAILLELLSGVCELLDPNEHWPHN